MVVKNVDNKRKKITDFHVYEIVTMRCAVLVVWLEMSSNRPCMCCLFAVAVGFTCVKRIGHVTRWTS